MTIRHPLKAMRLAFVVAALAVGSLPAAAATAGASPWVETEQTQVRLISATETAGDARTLKLGLQFKLKPHWKVYWRSPGDAGFPPMPDWSPSSNVKSAAIEWPVPARFSVLGLETLGYENEVVLPITVARADAARPVRVAGTVRYLTCKDICIPYEAELALTLPQGPVRPSPFAHLIGRYQSLVPGDGGRHGLAIDAAETWTRGDATLLRVRVRATMPLKAPDIYVEGPPPLAFSKPLVRLSGDARSAFLELEAYGTEGLTDPPAGKLAGRELTLTLVDGARTAERTITAAAVPGGTETLGARTPLMVILALAVIGGLILNLMPCVLPVLSIKLLGVVGHGGGAHRTVRLSFIASAAGILFAFAVLAAALVALKAGGLAIGWGIQFQQPWFLVAMTLVVTAFACNLWGFFEVRLPIWIADLGEHAGHVHGLGGHFLQGAFATLLATPCSAPFLGTAVGFALARGAAEIFLVFAALGIGLALPYLAVAAFPALATRLPRPGPWMITLRRLLGLALAATAAWLVSVLVASAGMAAAMAVGALAAAAGGFLYLRHRAPDGPGRPAPVLAAAAAVAALLAPGWLGDVGASGPAAQLSPVSLKAAQPEGLWQPFDEAAIPALVAAGKTVFVDVTADWCLTCQVNKAIVLGNAEVMAALRKGGVVAMKADWTRPDPVIAAYLARYQRYGIPFNVVYGPARPEGVVLPELLTAGVVLDAFAQAGGAKTAAVR